MIEEKEELQGQMIASGNVVASMIATKGAKGDPGEPGSPGQDGFSPIVETSKVGKVTTISITDAEGTTTATINDGEDGETGQPGDDGYSPSATVSKVGKIATITITDKDGTTTAEIRDGEDGSGTGDMLKSTYDTDNNGIVDNAEKVNNHTVQSDVPSNAVFTDTTYTAGTGIEITAGNVINNTQTSAEWGNISGDISDQTDLQTALSGKQNTIDSSHKLSADLVSETSDKKFLTTSGYQTIQGNKIFQNHTMLDGVATLTETYICDRRDEGDSCIFEFDADGYNYPQWNRRVDFTGGATTTTPVNNTDVANKKYVDDNIPTNISSLTNDSGYITGLIELSYGSSTWNDFETAFNANKIIYCKVGSGAVPGSTQLYKAALGAFGKDNQGNLNAAIFYRIQINNFSASNQCANRYVYILHKTAGWSYSYEPLSVEIAAGNNMTSSYSNGVLTLNAEAESIPVQNTAPSNPQEDDLWIDTSEPEEMQEAIVNEYSESVNETYSCDYVNDTIDGIIESGTANGGTYIKFFDGTLICRGGIGPITTNAGTGADLTITLPYNFKDRWYDLTASIIDGQAYWGQIQFSLITLSGSQFKLTTWNNSGGANTNQYFSYIAIGRWK